MKFLPMRLKCGCWFKFTIMDEETFLYHTYSAYCQVHKRPYNVDGDVELYAPLLTEDPVLGLYNRGRTTEGYPII